MGTRVPQQLVVGAARQWLLRHYMENEDFARERQAIRDQYRVTLRTVLAHAAEALEQRESAEKSREDMKRYAQDFPELKEYVKGLISLCSRWNFDYPWAPNLLLWEDLYETFGKTAEMDIAIASSLFSAMTGLPPSIVIEIPTFAVYAGKRQQVHKIIDAILDDLPQVPGCSDIPHGLPVHTKWLYANRALNMKPEDIYKDPKLNPRIGGIPTADVPQIKRVIQKLNPLLEGPPRSTGRPRKR